MILNLEVLVIFLFGSFPYPDDVLTIEFYFSGCDFFISPFLKGAVLAEGLKFMYLAIIQFNIPVIDPCLFLWAQFSINLDTPYFHWVWSHSITLECERLLRGMSCRLKRHWLTKHIDDIIEGIHSQKDTLGAHEGFSLFFELHTGLVIVVITDSTLYHLAVDTPHLALGAQTVGTFILGLPDHLDLY